MIDYRSALASALDAVVTDREKIEMALDHAHIKWGEHITVDPRTKELTVFEYIARVEGFKQAIHLPLNRRFHQIGNGLFVDLMYTIVPNSPRRWTSRHVHMP